MTKNISTTEPVSVARKVKELAEAAGDLDDIGYVDDLGGLIRLINPDLYIPVISDISIKFLALLSPVLFFTTFGLCWASMNMHGWAKKITMLFIPVTAILFVTFILIFPAIADHRSSGKETFEAREKYSTQAIEEIHKSILDSNDYNTDNLEPKVEDFLWELKGSSLSTISTYPTEAVLHWVNKDSGDVIFTTSHQKDTPKEPIESIEVIHGTKDIARVR